MHSRTITFKIINNIVNKESNLLSLESKLSNLDISQSDKAFIKNLCYVFFRNYYSAEKIAKEYIDNKTKPKAKHLIMLGIVQLFEISQPEYAIVSETVAVCDKIKLSWAKKLVNGVLRSIIRNIDAERLKYEKYKSSDMPRWLIDKIYQQYPTNSKDIITNSNKHANMFIRINKNIQAKDVYDYLEAKNVEYNKTLLENAICLEKPIDTDNELFKKGSYTVQDLSAQYAGHLIPSLTSQDRVLDACSAPGGKLSHLLELYPNNKITAIDISDKRISLLKSNINRFGISADNVELVTADLTQKLAGTFERIILDAPCSATGVIRRNPDIKVLRNNKDIDNITVIQKNILNNLWRNNLVKNGYILYITCSILKEENDKQIAKFLKDNQDANIVEIDILSGYRTEFGYQILPGLDSGDGFYYCLIHKS